MTALPGLLFALAVVLTACSPGVGAPVSPSAGAASATPALPTASPQVASSAVPTASAASTAPPGAPGTSAPPPTAPQPQQPWLALELVDVRTGETLRPADLIGKVVVIEPMAVWCANCRAQQNEARTALTNLASNDVIYISLDVDPFETAADLAQYADDRAYPWHFAVASDELARELANTFGDLALSPSATPKIVLAPDGRAEISFGIKSAADLEAELAALLN